ncbi:MAG: acetylpolyamine aminohydrolase [Firmicutes bacterium HGW-Firmicutes-13]|nr:MAG: acetylpolyamine aminohydrolase [Firmicutes bacterium HGW-Firmicutes-13]
MALLAAGATLKAAEIAMTGEFAFALCRPPGHHASPGSCWGFCYFNNAAIAVQKLLFEEKINSALIIDFDLHFGDGTSNIFYGNPKVNYRHVQGGNRISFIEDLEKYLDNASADIVAVSAGFDRHQMDWGHMLSTEDYHTMGNLLGSFARKNCEGRLFAALEGGYNPISLGDAVSGFLDGLQNSKA